MNLSSLDEPIAVIGFGLTGQSVVELLCEHGIRCHVFDKQTNEVILESQEKYGELFQFNESLSLPARIEEFATLIVSPGVDTRGELYQAARTRGVEILGDIELFARLNTVPVVAITGSNGKGTVTTLVGKMAQAAGLKVALGGNIGTPALNLLGVKLDLIVLELSSYQLETTRSLNAKVGTVLNVSPDHLDRYDSYEHYRQTKQKIYHLSESLVLNRDEPEIWPTTYSNRPTVNFGLSLPGAGEYGIRETQEGVAIAKGAEILIHVNECGLKGAHNWLNITAAIAIGQLLDLPLEAILQVCREFTGLPHRCQLVSVTEGVQWIDDSKATNIGAMMAAIEGFGMYKQGRLILLAGGQGKGADFSKARESLARYCDEVLLFGEDAALLREAWSVSVPCEMTESMFVAMDIARERAVAGDIVLLSPACASFDQFTSFAERGERFKEYVDGTCHRSA